MVYDPYLGLRISDSVCFAIYIGCLAFETYIIKKYLIPLRIKSPYILMFYCMLTVMLVSMIIMLAERLFGNDPGFIVSKHQKKTVGEVCVHIQATAYILLGFIISATEFQLAVSLALILNIIDVKEANARKTTFNICVSIISVVTCIGAYLETTIDDLANASHLVFEAIGLIVLCLIYFSTSVELLRKLRIFVLEETLKEARLVQL